MLICVLVYTKTPFNTIAFSRNKLLFFIELHLLPMQRFAPTLSPYAATADAARWPCCSPRCVPCPHRRSHAQTPAPSRKPQSCSQLPLCRPTGERLSGKPSQPLGYTHAAAARRRLAQASLSGLLGVTIIGTKSYAKGVFCPENILLCQVFKGVGEGRVLASATRELKTPAQAYRGVVNISPNYRKWESKIRLGQEREERATLVCRVAV